MQQMMPPLHPTTKWWEGCKISWWVCLFVFLSVCLYNSKNTQLNFTKFLCTGMLFVALAYPSLVALRYVMYFWFCGWHHVFKRWPYGTSCVFLSGNRIWQA